MEKTSIDELKRSQSPTANHRNVWSPRFCDRTYSNLFAISSPIIYRCTLVPYKVRRARGAVAWKQGITCAGAKPYHILKKYKKKMFCRS